MFQIIAALVLCVGQMPSDSSAANGELDSGQPRITEVRVEPGGESPRGNLIENSSFEQVSDGRLASWQWSVAGRTDAAMVIDENISRSGKRSIRLTNGTPLTENVFGVLTQEPRIAVKPETVYTLSFYARTENPGMAWVGGARDWRLRIPILPTEGKWQRFQEQYTTLADETTFDLRVLTESTCTEFWVDDLKLEEGGGGASMYVPPDGTSGLVIAEPEGTVVVRDGTWEQVFSIWSSQEVESVSFTVALYSGPCPFSPASPRGLNPAALSSEQYVTRVPPGFSALVVRGEAIDVADDPYRLSVEADGHATVTAQLRIFSPAHAEKRLQKVEADAIELEARLQQVARNRDAAYPQVSLTIIKDFVGYVRQDLRAEQYRLAFDGLKQLEQIARQVGHELDRLAQPTAVHWPVPKYVTSPIGIDGPSFLSTVEWPDGKTEQRPVFFTGYGHFDEVRRYLDRFGEFAVNIIQIEMGPKDVLVPEGDDLPGGGGFQDDKIQEVRSVLDRAAKANVAVNLLISPHYMPDWLIRKHSELGMKRQGFIPYSTFAPIGQEILKAYTVYVIERVKDHPALHSICLSNEPINVEAPDSPLQLAAWHAWLERRHADIATLNQRWGSSYAGFADVPVPTEWFSGMGGHHYDFAMFNQDFFTGWHRMIADAVHSVAPNLPVHAKAMTWNFFNGGDQRYGVSAERFGSFSQINGNDAINCYLFNRDRWANEWYKNKRGHILQRSTNNAPVFNSENHLIADGETRTVPPEHIRSALWQAAIYGQSATTIWVWERTYDMRHVFAGSIMHRPACVEAASHTAMDLMRLAPQVRQLQNKRYDVAMLYSTAALMLDGNDHWGCMERLHNALSITGLKVGFVTDRQLAEGQTRNSAVLFVPNTRHLPEQAYQGLKRYWARVVIVGDENALSLDEYGQPRTVDIKADRIPFRPGVTTEEQLWAACREQLPQWHIQPEFDVTAPDGSAVWGVEWLAARCDGRWVVNLIQHANQSARVIVTRDGQMMAGTDLLNRKPIQHPIELEPMKPILMQID